MRCNINTILSGLNLNKVRQNPQAKHSLKVGSFECIVSVCITEIHKNIDRTFSSKHNIKTNHLFEHFGLLIEFKQHVEIMPFDEEYILSKELKKLITEFGPVFLRNVEIEYCDERVYQKNIFPGLMFHIDRGKHFENQYSLFYRNPNDDAHKKKRNTSSLFIPNNAAELQASKEGTYSSATLVSSQLFDSQTIGTAIGNIVHEHVWDAPENYGEICIFDNRTILHASHHYGEKCYPIAVQYLY